jgi:hypothetical protein
MNTLKLFASAMILGIALATSLWAQTSSTPSAPSHAQIKREAELQKQERRKGAIKGRQSLGRRNEAR